MNPKRNLISAAVVLAIAAAASPAFATLERLGPVDRSPTIGGYPAWFQDHTGVAVDFCDPKSQAELTGGWCTVLPGNVNFPESFPGNFFNEHFYYDAVSKIGGGGGGAPAGFTATLIVALEGAFVNGKVVDGDQMTFTRLRIQIPAVPQAGDYRVVTPFSDTWFPGLKAGDKIFDTLDVGLGCPGTFECTLNGTLGPFLLPSATSGGTEVPPMPDLASAPAGTDPFFDLLVAGAATTANPGTGSKYIADPARIGTITGSPMPAFQSATLNAVGQMVFVPQNHNTFHIEGYPDGAAAQPIGSVVPFMSLDGSANFTVAGRLKTNALAGNITAPRSTYKADIAGNVTDLDVYTKASSTVQARLPAQPTATPVVPVINFYDQACGNALITDPVTGLTSVGPGPYTAPAGLTAHSLASTGNDFWGQSSPAGLPPSHVCIEDTTSHNIAGQVVPTYTLVPVTDQVTITTAHYVGPQNGTLSVNAVSSDPTAVLTLAGYGPAGVGTPGVSIGTGVGTGLDLAGGAAQVLAVAAPPSKVQIVSSRGGSQLRETDTAHGSAVLLGVPSAVNDSVTMNEDCSAVASLGCVAGAGVTVDLLANDTVMLAGVVQTLRNVVNNGLATVTVSAQPARLGTATVTADGIMTYTPNPNANGTDNVTYTVTVDGTASNQAVVAVTITPVNDVPVAGTQSVGAVNAKVNVLNLLTGSTDLDGNSDVKEAVITSWPAQLGPQPVPSLGVISYTPKSAASGPFTINYQVRDAAGAVSSNTGAATVTVLAAENIAAPVNKFTIKTGRWVVTTTDTVRANQTVTIAYLDGTIRATGQTCNGTATIPECVLGTTTVSAAGAILFDQTGFTGLGDPTSTLWSVAPKNLRVFSSSPNLGGAGVAGFTTR